MSIHSLAEGCFLASSGRLYRALLVLYPRDFLREFGPQMTQVFRDACRQAHDERGAAGILSLWVLTIGDLVATALPERLAQGGHMFFLSRPVLVRAGGVAAMLGGSLYVLSSLTHPSGPLRAAVPGSILCLIVGVMGLHALLGAREGRLGWLGFALVGVGLVLGLIGMGGSAIGIIGPNPVASIINTGEHAGLAFIGAGMLLWGLIALRVRALGRWSALPFVLGLLSLAGGILVPFPDAFAAVEHSLVPLVFAAVWIPFGYALLRGRTDAAPIPTQPDLG
jgi:hypothetical protein